EPERVAHVQRESARLRTILTEAGMRTGQSETAVIPLIAGSDERAYDYATACRKAGVIGLPVVSPAVPNTLARLRIAVTARHSTADIDVAAEAFPTAARPCRLIEACPMPSVEPDVVITGKGGVTPAGCTPQTLW